MQSLARGGEPLGYEPLGFEGMNFHTWLCHDTPKETVQRFGIRPNHRGFMNMLEDAMRDRLPDCNWG